MMAIDDKLAKIRQRSASLNAKTDKLNEAFDHVNYALADAGVGVEFWMDAPELCHRRQAIEDDHRSRVTYWVLGYTKIGVDWCLAVQERLDVFEGEDILSSEDIDNPVPLRKASRAVRMAASDHLENFLVELEKAMAKMEKGIEHALDVAAVVAPQPSRPPAPGLSAKDQKEWEAVIASKTKR